MGLNEYKLGQLIEQTNEINTKLQFKAKDVMGMTITKEIIPTKADVKNTELNKFLIVHPNEFVYNPRTHGKKIGLGFNDSGKSFIISWNNIAFRVKLTAKDIIEPKYLFLHLNRTEWDRRACYDSWGSSTEVFSWKSFCDMDIELPDIDIQRKYVAVYDAMTENQKSYEQGLEDLKLTCDGFVEELKKSYKAEEIGKYLILSEKRNDIGLGVDTVRGLAVSKQMIPTKADMDGVSLSSYKVVPPRHIAYVPDTSRRGDKMSLGYNDTEETLLVSSISTVFTTDTNYLLPEYLLLFFCRSEFDRYARFHSWGSARETFDWKTMCEVNIPIPEKEKQKAISEIFQAYTLRKEINEQLKTQIKEICPILIKGSLEEARA